MEEGMREGARQQRTIEARERATNEAREERRKGGRNNMPPRLSPTTAANVRVVRSRSLLVSCRSPSPSSREEKEGKRRGRATDPTGIASEKSKKRRISLRDAEIRNDAAAAPPRVLDRRTPSQSPPQLNRSLIVQHLYGGRGPQRRENGCMMPPECPTRGGSL